MRPTRIKQNQSETTGRLEQIVRLNYAALTRTRHRRLRPPQGYLMRQLIRQYWVERQQIFLYLRDVKWMILITILLCVLLSVPDQIRELYRIFIDNITFISFIREDIETVVIELIRFVVPLVAIALGLWFGTYQITTESIQRDPISPKTNIARILPPLCGALPLFACALGQFLAKPDFSSIDSLSELPAGPWDEFRKGLHTVELGLNISSGVFFVLGIVMLVTSWKLTERARSWSNRLNKIYLGHEISAVIAVAVIVLFTIAFLGSPVVFPQLIGPFAIFAVYTLCVVAFCLHFTLLAIKWHLPFIAALLSLALLFSFFDWNDDHEVRPLVDSTVTGNSDTLEPLASDQFGKWYANRSSLANYDVYPIYIIASEGGGIYAAYQTATFLARLYDYCPAFNDHLFAISSVSGGSLGAAAYAAAVNSTSFNPTPAEPVAPTSRAAVDSCPKITEYLSGERPIPKGLQEPGRVESAVRKMLKSDFLSPLLAGAMFTDFTQAFIPYPIDVFDRARFLEFAFEHSESALDVAQLSYLTQDVRSAWLPDGRVPALVINTTDAGSGRRVIISPFMFSRSSDENLGAFVHYQDLGQASGTKSREYPPAIRISTAAVISARFPWVTPAATIPVGDDRLGPQDKIRLVDGGYVDNSGVETALDLIRSIQDKVDEINRNAVANPSPTIWPGGTSYRKVSLKLIVLSGGGYPIRSSFSLGDLLEPIRALLDTRESRSFVAIDRAVELYPLNELATVSDTTVRASDLRQASLDSHYYTLPLGWSLSNRTRRIIEKQSGYFWSCDPDNNFLQSHASLSQADCIQLLIYHELHNSTKRAANDIALINKLRIADPPIHVTHYYNRLIACYRNALVPFMEQPQSQALDDLLNVLGTKAYGSDDHLLAIMLATIANETDDFRVSKENFDFPTAERIHSLFKEKNFPTVEDAIPYVHNPKELAIKVHGVGFQGNTEPEDGWTYRGRGMPMLEGREEYSKFGKRINIDLLANPELVMNPVVGAAAALEAYFNESVRSNIMSYLSERSDDWAGATQFLVRVGNKNGIPAKSAVFYRCIKDAKLN